MIKHSKVVKVFDESLGDFYATLMEDLGNLNDYEGYFDSAHLPCPEYSPNHEIQSFSTWLYYKYGNEMSKGKEDYDEWLDWVIVNMQQMGEDE